ncbi:aminoacyl-tRNA hydrolase [Desulfoluna spongiiphila]|uniref:Peptidyl-tRNA hydrolase n=1 Tax=Desulfoluna spongiiphila TaxID=419481 RepID=A0A1G5GFC3_9BACT|nr:aminoacyl-tRNA hydrolase [Desulfoluna spongiiphila]SCY50272.1 peptidyl-tRNA hydrolase [Desulfoluna spongiiphila]VVS93589.1 peptidyl-trna hydrolase [Desulfoluna spongiiphila]
MSESSVRLVVGLGNPGARYENTRHNIGFRVIDRLAERLGMSVTRSRFNALYAKGRHEGREVILAKPQSFMNLSGGPVRALADYFDVEPGEILVVYDEIDLVYGRMKIVAKGGHGGHNGVRSLIDTLKDREFARIRMGVGRPDPRIEVSDWVLGRFSAEEAASLDSFIDRSADAVDTILSRGLKMGMNAFNCVK